jgi:hypothetical protein
MLRPYSRMRTSRPRALAEEWTGPEWTLLEHHDLPIAAAPEATLAALAGVRLRDLPAVRALFTLRRLPHSADTTLRGFFSARPFVVLAEEPGRELAFGVLLPGRGRRAPDGADAFRAALPTAPFAAIGTFGAFARPGGSVLWTDTWARTRGVRSRAGFAAYWLAIGPWSAWIRRMFLRAARARAELSTTP